MEILQIMTAAQIVKWTQGMHVLTLLMLKAPVESIVEQEATSLHLESSVMTTTQIQMTVVTTV